MNLIRRPAACFFATALPSLLGLLLIVACGGAKTTPTNIPVSPTVVTPTASGPNPLLLTPNVPRTGSAVSSPATVASASTVYSDPQGRFSFTIPAGFQQTAVPPQQQPTVIARFASPTIDALLLVEGQAMEPSATLDEKTTAARGAASKFPGSQLLTNVPPETTFAGQAARQFEFLLPLNGTQYHVLSINTVRNKVFYTVNIQIAAQNYDANIDQAKTAVNTFMFLGTG